MLETDIAPSCWKAAGLDLSAILYKPPVPEGTKLYQTVPQDHGLERTLDARVLLGICEPP
jgi:hypothetical protein